MSEVDINAPEVQAAIQEAVKAATEGAEAKKKELLNETKEAKKRAAEAQELASKLDGVDLEEFARLKEAEAKKEEAEAEKKGEYDKLTNNLREKHKEDLEKANTSTEHYKSLAYGGVVSSEISNALISEKGSPELLTPVVKARTKVIEEDGVLKTIGLNEDGTPMLTEDGSHGTPMDVVKHLKTMPAYQPAFAAHQIAGGGSRSSVAGYTGKNPFKAETRNLTEQAKLLREQPALAQTLKAEAGV